MVPPLTAGSIATIVAGALTFDWSLGFQGLTYDDIYKRSAAHRGMRVPARFSVVVGAALALLGAFGAARILRLGRTPAARGGLCAALTLAVLFDLRLDPRLETYHARIPSIYDSVTSDMVLVEFPRYHDVEYMYFSTRHWARMLVVYSGFIPYDDDVEQVLRTFPSAESLDRRRRRGATHLTYNCGLEEKASLRHGVRVPGGSPAVELVASGRWERRQSASIGSGHDTVSAITDAATRPAARAFSLLDVGLIVAAARPWLSSGRAHADRSGRGPDRDPRRRQSHPIRGGVWLRALADRRTFPTAAGAAGPGSGHVRNGACTIRGSASCHTRRVAARGGDAAGLAGLDRAAPDRPPAGG